MHARLQKFEGPKCADGYPLKPCCMRYELAAATAESHLLDRVPAVLVLQRHFPSRNNLH